MSDNDVLDSEEDFPFIDGADIVREQEIKLQAGETIPHTLDYAALSAFENFDADEFETKLYPVKNKKEKKKNKFMTGKSKFFKISEEDVEFDLEDQIKQAERDWNKNTLRGTKLIDLQTTDVVKVDKKLKKQFIENLGTNIETIKDFLINKTAPTELAVSNAFEQSRQTLDSILGIKLEGTNKQLRAMISDAVILKTFAFIAQSLDLEEEHKQTIINKYFVLTVPKTTKRVK